MRDSCHRPCQILISCLAHAVYLDGSCHSCHFVSIEYDHEMTCPLESTCGSSAQILYSPKLRIKRFHVKFIRNFMFIMLFFFFLIFVMPFFSKIHVCHAEIHAASCRATSCHFIFSCEIMRNSCDFMRIF